MVFTSCLRNTIFQFLAENNYIEHIIQQGFTPKLSGTLEHTAQMAHIINNARLKQRSLIITLLDLKIAFGEVHHNLISEVLKHHHIPPHIMILIKSLYIGVSKLQYLHLISLLRILLFSAVYYRVTVSVPSCSTCVLILSFSILDLRNFSNSVSA